MKTTAVLLVIFLFANTTASLPLISESTEIRVAQKQKQVSQTERDWILGVTLGGFVLLLSGVCFGALSLSCCLCKMNPEKFSSYKNYLIAAGLSGLVSVAGAVALATGAIWNKVANG